MQVNNEQRNVWKMYADKNKFDLAKKFCSNNLAHLDTVLVKEAEYLFHENNFNESALIYSRTKTSFEEICLKFLEINENDGLLIYLQNRLLQLDPTDKTQLTMLVIWIIEIYLAEMARHTDNLEKVSTLQAEFDSFKRINQVMDCINSNKSVIYDLISSHADNHNLTTLAKIDQETLINQYINQNNFLEAINVLKHQNNQDLYYKYCPILMENHPKETISLIINLSQPIKILNFLPTLMNIESDEHASEILRYLEYSIYTLGCTDQAIHNYLILLYSIYNKEQMLQYLESQGKYASMVCYDINYALRVCTEHNLNEACVFLQRLLDMWLSAVKLALTFDVQLAQDTAFLPKDPKLKKSLWLIIAEYKIKLKEDMDEAIELMKLCDLLKIEDLLPFFSDFQKIDKFKSIICDALQVCFCTLLYFQVIIHILFLGL